ncbi:MAG TPA: DUF1573 domain-containing protein [Gemmataceae bacterium]|nr:DUF1573 domain-containing protein [Gemmataceae bacterium]
MLRYSLVLVLGLAMSGTASASTWADSLFDEFSRDFGGVPRGPTLSHPFHIVNKTNGPIQIASVRVSCGCTSAKVLQNQLAPGQETAIMVEMDTRRFSGTKEVIIYVQFNQPKFDEVRLKVQANSRDDVSVLPESLALGKVKRGAPAAFSTNVTLLGNQNWQITAAASDSNYVLPNLQEVRRGGGEVAYKLTASVRPDTPAGKWFTDVWLQTNNPQVPRIRVPLTVEVEPQLTISPSTLTLGELKAGKAIERKVIVRGVRPFRILSVQGTDKELSVRDDTTESKNVHVLSVTLNPQHVGQLQRAVRVLTDVPGEESFEIYATAQIVK